MRYNQPLDVPDNPNASYQNGNPEAGIEGSVVPGAAIEYDQREVVEVVSRANSRAYVDFNAVACAAPANTDLTQLRKAIEGFIIFWQFVIDTEVTFHVHGPNADFPDLIAAMRYLGRYRITPRGHVILQLAGANWQSDTIAQQFVYNETVWIQHPNNDRISILGARMFSALKYQDDQYASNGYALATRNSDVITNTATLRHTFTTELRFASLAPISVPGLYTGPAGIAVGAIALMDLDSILVTCDNSVQAGFLFTSSGYMNFQTHHGGLAVVGGNYGFIWDVGACMAVEGEGQSIELLTTFVSIGAAACGIALWNGGFVTVTGNAVCINGGANGFMVFPRAGTQWDGGVFASSNVQNGVLCYHTANCYIAGTQVNGDITGRPSHFWKNGQWGCNAAFANVAAYADFGGGVNANAAGSCYAAWGTAVNGWYAGAPAFYGASSPPFGVIGNISSIID